MLPFLVFFLFFQISSFFVMCERLSPSRLILMGRLIIVRFCVKRQPGVDRDDSQPSLFAPTIKPKNGRISLQTARSNSIIPGRQIGLSGFLRPRSSLHRLHSIKNPFERARDEEDGIMFLVARSARVNTETIKELARANTCLMSSSSANH